MLKSEEYSRGATVKTMRYLAGCFGRLPDIGAVLGVDSSDVSVMELGWGLREGGCRHRGDGWQEGGAQLITGFGVM